nr:hypothetical protein [Tanacetum cinerariifolium]
MIAYLIKFDASEGFHQIIDFLNGSSIKYALTVNPNIYVSCIKQFWTSIAVKKVDDVTRLQALVDKKKVVITEATVRDALRLASAEGIEFLPNEEIFTELARMGYEKPLTKLKFYKAFFSSQWKFLIHTMLQCMSAKRTSWNEFSSSMASVVICLSTVGDLSLHSTKYTSPALTQKVFANMRRVGKGFSGVDTPLFEGMIVEQQVGEEPSIPSPTSPTPPPQPSQDQPYTSQVQPTLPQSPQAQQPSPQQQPQHSQDARISMDLFQNLLDACTTLTKRVEHLEQDKIAQALEITKLKQRVKRLERRNKASKLRRLKRGRIIADIDADVDVILEDAKEVAIEKSGDVKESADIQGRKAESQAQIYQIDLEHANKVLSMQDDESKQVEFPEVVEVVTTAKLITEVVTAASAIITAATLQLTTAAASTLTTAPSAARKKKGVVIRDPKETATLSIIIHSEAKSKDKGKVILIEEPKPLKNQAQIKQDKAYARELEAELNKNIDWDEVINHVQRKQKE